MEELDVKKAIEGFFETCEHSIYNEISMQCELGYYFRQNYPKYNVRFERNVKFYEGALGAAPKRSDWIKHEIDIVLFRGEDELNSNEKIAIELKYPRNGEYPEQMFSFIKDIKFMEQVRSLPGFQHCYVLTLVDSPAFYRGKHDCNPYNLFRDKNERINILGGVAIQKPTGNHGKESIPSICLRGLYVTSWQKINKSAKWMDPKVDRESYRYYILEAKCPDQK